MKRFGVMPGAFAVFWAVCVLSVGAEEIELKVGESRIIQLESPAACVKYDRDRICLRRVRARRLVIQGKSRGKGELTILSGGERRQYSIQVKGQQEG